MNIIESENLYINMVDFFFNFNNLECFTFT